VLGVFKHEQCEMVTGGVHVGDTHHVVGTATVWMVDGKNGTLDTGT